ncbi:hypothetical protein V1477_008325 [Vespula maculifrons]|uniref:Uncharacterized protein n=1 Tax=Vespula maculifrons TaxID=7453 RepID=A0ABD2CCP7_VESMC
MNAWIQAKYSTGYSSHSSISYKTVQHQQKCKETQEDCEKHYICGRNTIFKLYEMRCLKIIFNSDID